MKWYNDMNPMEKRDFQNLIIRGVFVGLIALALYLYFK
jgi:hypothetical protein